MASITRRASKSMSEVSVEIFERDGCIIVHYMQFLSIYVLREIMYVALVESSSYHHLLFILLKSGTWHGE